MFRNVLIPVDPARLAEGRDALRQAIALAAPGARLTLVSMAERGGAEAVRDSLARLTWEHAPTPETMVIECGNPALDAGIRLVGVVAETGADLVVMPGHTHRQAPIFASHVGYVAANAAASVFILKGSA